MTSTLLLNSLGPVLAYVLFGYVLGYMRWVNSSHITIINRWVFYLLLPVFIFNHMAEADLTHLKTPGLFFAFYGAVIIMILAAYIWQMSKVTDKLAASCYGITISYSNAVMFGFPLLHGAFGVASVGPMFALLVLHSGIIFGLTSLLQGGGNTFVRVLQTLKNPIIVAIALGVLVNLTGIAPSGVTKYVLDIVSAPALPVALCMLGFSLWHHGLKGARRNALQASVLKLIVFPFVVFVLCQLLGLDTLLTSVAVILAACPTGINAHVMCCIYQRQEKLSAATVSLSTLLCFVTMPLWLLLVRQ